MDRKNKIKTQSRGRRTYLRESLLIFLLIPSVFWGTLHFLHIKKTGGCSIHTLLENHYQKEDFYPLRYIENRNTIWSSFSQSDAEITFNNYQDIHSKVISGHFPYWFLKKKDPNFDSSFIFTCLREPIDRVLSHYFYYLKLGRGLKSPLEIAPNVMCKMLASDITLQGESLLQDAINTLHHMNFIIFMDDFENGIARLFQKLGFEQPDSIPHENISKRDTVDKETLLMLEEMNDLDIRLYEYAKFALRHKSY
jgi:hypothetical protein